MATRTVSLTIKLTAAEAAKLTARAAEAGLPLRPYIRREVLRADALPKHTALVLIQLARMDELTRRIWTAAADDQLRPGCVTQIADAVDAVEDRVLLARAAGAR
jgi:FAD/FMN-containing dehydrogenase